MNLLSLSNIIPFSLLLSPTFFITTDFTIKSVVGDPTACLYLTDTYTILGQDSSVTYNGESVTPSTVYTVGQDNYVYLKHGQTAIIGTGANDSKIIPGNTYQVIEDSNDYETYINGSTTDNKDSGILNLTTTSNDNSVNISNVKDSSPMTGGTFKYLPYVIIISVVVIGAIIFILRNKLRKEV